jgi:Rrf2 family protein
VISRTSQYALDVLRCLARDPGSRVATDALARATGVPANYLSKILSQLRKQKVVEGEKGWGGGFRLQAGALDRPIGEIVAIFDGLDPTARDKCLFGLRRCDAAHPCALHPFWERIRGPYEEMLAEVRVRDLLTEDRRR